MPRSWRLANYESRDGVLRLKDRRDESDIEFKARMDPHNLLNPGKLDFTVAPATQERSSLPTDGWARRWKNA